MEPALPPGVEAALRAVPQFAGAPTNVTRLAVSTSNTNLRVDVRGESFVARVFGDADVALGVDRETEIEATRVAAAVGSGPPVVAFIPEHGCLVTRYIAGTRVNPNDLQRPEVLSAAVGCLRAFHACPPLSTVFSVFRTTERYLQLAAERGVELSPELEHARTIAERIEASPAGRPTLVRLCHNEMMGENLIWDGMRIWMTDYEFAGTGDPWFDLGDLAAAHDLPPADQERMLRLYLGTVNDHDRARLGLMTVMSDLREAAWATLHRAVSPLPFDFEAHAGWAVRRCLERADAGLDDWLSELIPASA